MSDLPLALKYRPRTFDDVQGQGHVKYILKQMVKTKQVPPALVFSGSRGTGKTTSGRILGAALNCEADVEEAPCTTCASCLAVAAGNGIDVLEIDAASNGTVGEIRKLKDAVMYSVGGRFRVVLLDEAHSMSKEAFNALLKVLEEPPPNTVFILLTTEPNKILETVLSRCMPFEFRRMTAADIVARLNHIITLEELTVDPALLEAIAYKVQGGMRDAVMLLDQVTRTGVATVEGFNELFGISDVSVQLVGTALDGDMATGYKIIEEYFFRVGDAAGMVTDLTSLVRDLLVIRAGGDPRVPTEIEAAARRDLAARVPTEKLVATCRILWELKSRTRHVDNDQRAAMELAYALIVEALAGSSASTMAPAAPARRLTLQELAQA